MAGASIASVGSGIANLDYILDGGYLADHTHVIEGSPGAGKMVLGLQFLAAGRDIGERTLYISVGKGRAEVARIAEAHGLDFTGIDVFELVPPEDTLDPTRSQSIIYAADLELGETVRRVMDHVVALSPRRVVFSNFSEIRLLAQETHHYRRQLLALQHFFARLDCTALLLEDQVDRVDASLEAMSACVIRLEQIADHAGAERRRLRVIKMRGRIFRGGYHDFVVDGSGLRVFPRFVALDQSTVEQDDLPVSSGLGALDSLVGGGVERGTSLLIRGATGVGKSIMALQYVRVALARGESALYLNFDESLRSFRRRARGMAMAVDDSLASGQLAHVRIDPAQMSPGELADLILTHVERGARTVVFDSLAGLGHAMAGESDLANHLHELLTYLGEHNVLTILLHDQSGTTGPYDAPMFTSYLADTVLLIRYFEIDGDIRRAISVVKKRTGPHERTLRELSFDRLGVHVGRVLTGMSGMLSGMPISTDGAPLAPGRPVPAEN
jgi:circadian clock protein KaiC